MSKLPEVIPAIDLVDGKVVRLKQGSFEDLKVYSEDPLETAINFANAGYKRLHLVDLDGAKSRRITHLKILESIVSKTSLSVDYGGGIKNIAEVETIFLAGASYVVIGSLAYKHPEVFKQIIQKFSSQKIILASDVKNEMIAVSGWLEKTEVNIFDFLTSFKEEELCNVLCTDISKDGMLEGPAIELYENLVSRFPQINFIASGGVSSDQDLEDLAKVGICQVVVGKALLEGRITFGYSD